MNDIQAVQLLHAQLLRNYPGGRTVAEVLTAQAETLLMGHQTELPGAAVQIKHWFPPLVARPSAEIFEYDFSLADARLTIAREHGFAGWAAVNALGDTGFDLDFERAANAVVTGDLVTLRELLAARRELVQSVSVYGHRATLLHYVAANGVETWRQTVPQNAPEIARALIAAGADKDATMPVYNGAFTTLELLLTSAHPAGAGLTEAIAKVLKVS